MAWVALDLARPTHPGIAVARYVRLAEDPTIAEPAVTVLDEYQGRGIGTALLVALARSARAHGIEAFRAHVLADNTPMVHLLRGLGATVAHEGSLLRVDVAIPSRPEELPDTPTGRVFRAAARRRCPRSASAIRACWSLDTGHSGLSAWTGSPSQVPTGREPRPAPRPAPIPPMPSAGVAHACGSLAVGGTISAGHLIDVDLPERVAPGTPGAWVTPPPAHTPRRLVISGGFCVDGGHDRQLSDQAPDGEDSPTCAAACKPSSTRAGASPSSPSTWPPPNRPSAAPSPTITSTSHPAASCSPGAPPSSASPPGWSSSASRARAGLPGGPAGHPGMDTA